MLSSVCFVKAIGVSRFNMVLATDRVRRRIHLCLVALWFVAFGSPLAAAHEVRPALLQITLSAKTGYVVVWKQPTVGKLGLRLQPQLSSGALDIKPTREYSAPGFLIREWVVEPGVPLEGQTLRIAGLSQSVTDVLLRITWPNGDMITTVIKPAHANYRITKPAASGDRHGLAVPAYLGLGVSHIATGLDHLAFVLGLLLLIGPGWRIVKAVSAFTLAHSLTLGSAALGFVRFDAAIIEVLIALSIVFIARELLRPKGAEPTLAWRSPWVIALLFGLLHGLGFAGALAQIGLPKGEAFGALLLFNLGVEIGQLGFIAAALLVMVSMRRARTLMPSRVIPILEKAPAYIIGSASAFWMIERMVGLWQSASG